jgi:hypothetical protein
MVAGAGIMLYALIVEPVPVLNYTRNYSTLNVRPGDTVSVSAVVNRASSCSSTVARQWIDVQGNTVGEVTEEDTATKAAGVEEYFDEITIPKDVLPGPLRFRVKTMFYCNFMQRLLGLGATFVMPDVIFTVQATGDQPNDQSVQN